MLHRLLFDANNMAESANLGAFLRMGSTGKLATYSTLPEAGNVTFNFVDGDVTVGTDNIAEVAHGLKLGDIVRLTTSGTLPAGLALATDYYVIRVDADNFKLASSLANAELGIAVDITAAAGGGTHTVTEQERVHSALDVNVVNPVNAVVSGTVAVTATNLDIRDLVFATDKVDVSGSEVSLDAGTLAALENITVSATDLDIRNLVFATDSVDVSGSSVSITGTVAVTQSTSPWVVSATDFDIRDIDASQDNIQSWVFDGTGNAIGSTSGALNVNIANAGEIAIDLTHNTAIYSEAETVTGSAAVLIATPLANRENLMIYNNGNKEVYIGQSGVTVGSGFPVFPGSLLEMKLGPAVVPYAISATGSQDVRVLQLS